MKVMVTGATGFVGKSLVAELILKGHEVVALTRNAKSARKVLGPQCQFIEWNAKTLLPVAAFQGVDGIINLMGESIANGRWTENQKKKLYDSRIKGTSLLMNSLKNVALKPKVLVSASAIGLYGDRGDEALDEFAVPADDFLAQLCTDWEESGSNEERFSF